MLRTGLFYLQCQLFARVLFDMTAANSDYVMSDGVIRSPSYVNSWLIFLKK